MDSADIAILFLLGEGGVADKYLEMSKLAFEVRRKYKTLTNPKHLRGLSNADIRQADRRCRTLWYQLTQSKLFLTKYWDFQAEVEKVEFVIAYLSPFCPHEDKWVNKKSKEVRKSNRQLKALNAKNFTNKHRN